MSREDSRYSRRFSGEMNRDQQKTSAPKSLPREAGLKPRRLRRIIFVLQ
ncbi:MAG: hypothetical protein KA714_02545 [Limnoraphis sp. WC205]|nr:hypothetical protein [Limnoraphis sp. WC205]